jgi:hypothetical protein
MSLVVNAAHPEHKASDEVNSKGGQNKGEFRRLMWSVEKPRNHESVVDFRESILLRGKHCYERDYASVQYVKAHKTGEHVRGIAMSGLQKSEDRREL